MASACAIRWGPPAEPAAVREEQPSAPPFEQTVVATATALIETPETGTPEAVKAELPAGGKAEPSEVAEPTRWTVGLLAEPAILVPFSPDGRAAAPIVEAMFPAPALGMDYTYTTTGVLEELPAPDNGGVERKAVSGYLDATGQFTTTATSQPTTTEQLVVTFHWNPALTWADGTAVTAADSVFAWEEARRAPPTPEAAALVEMVETYEAVETHTTRAVLHPGRIELTYPLAAWPPAPRHLLADASEETRQQYARAPLGYGPYTFAEALPGESIVLRRNDYWPDDDLPEQLRFDFFASAEELRAATNRGDVDVAWLEQLPPELYRFLDQDAASGASDVHWRRGPVYEHLDLNLAEPLFGDVRVRRAIAHAIDRQALVDELFGGKTEVLESWIFPEQPEYAGDEQLTRYTHDPQRARSLLEQAGLQDTNGDRLFEAMDGTPITLTLLTSDTPLRVEMARRIEADLRSAGLRVRTEPIPLDQFYAPTGPLFRRQFQMALFAWLGAVDPGGLPLWSCAAIPSEENGFTGNNFAGWCFDPAEWPLRAATSSIEPRTRAAAYLRHQQHWSREAPTITLLQRPIVVLHRPEVEGVAPDALAPITWNIDEWKRDE